MDGVRLQHVLTVNTTYCIIGTAAVVFLFAHVAKSAIIEHEVTKIEENRRAIKVGMLNPTTNTRTTVVCGIKMKASTGGGGQEKTADC